MKHLPLIIIIFCWMAGCDIRHEMPCELTEAERLMFVRPDSSLKILTAYSPSKFSDKEKALYALLITQAKSRNYLIPQNDSVIKIAIDYYSNIGNEHRLAWAYLYASDIHDQLNNDSLAMYYIRKAHHEAENVHDNLLHYYINYFHGNMTRYYPPYDIGIKHLSKAKEYAELMEDTARIITCLNEIGATYIFLKENEKARQHLLEASNLSQAIHDSEQLSYIYKLIALSYYADKQESKSISYINKAIELIPYIKNYGDTNSIYSLKGKLLALLGETDSAEIYINRGLNPSSTASKGNYEKNMSDIEEARGNYKKAISHLKLYSIYKDSVEDAKLNDKIATMEKKYDMAELLLKKKEADLNTYRLSLALLTMILIMAGIIWVASKMIERKKQALLEAEKTRESLIYNAEESIWTKASEIIKQRDMHTDSMRDYILEADEVVKKIREVLNMSDKQRISSAHNLKLSDKEIAHLAELINISYNGLIDRITAQNPGLTDDDISLFCLMKLNVENHDIYSLLNLNGPSLTKRKQRLKKRLNIDGSVEKWIMGKQ